MSAQSSTGNPATMPAKPNRRRHDPEDSEAHAHRRAVDTDAVLHLHGRVGDCEESIRKLLQSQRDMADNLKSLNQNLGRVADVLEALSNFKGFWMTLRLMSGAAKVVLPLLAVAGAVWLFLKTGQWRMGA